MTTTSNAPKDLVVGSSDACHKEQMLDDSFQHVTIDGEIISEEEAARRSLSFVTQEHQPMHDSQQEDDDDGNDDDAENNESSRSTLRIGDHVYLWSFFAHSTPGVAFRHGIVYSINEDCKQVEIIDLHAMIRRKPTIRRFANIRIDSAGNLRSSAFEESRGTWKRVKYGTHWLRRSISASGTCTFVQGDPTKLVLERLKFLMNQYEKEKEEKIVDNVKDEDEEDNEEEQQHSIDTMNDSIHQSNENNQENKNEEKNKNEEIGTSITENDQSDDEDQDETSTTKTGLPRYHVLKANSECVAVWIKTGTWATLQASSWLHSTVARQVRSTTSLAIMANNTQVTVPARGLWGLMGYSTQASLLSTYPWLLPAVASYGVLTVGGPVWVLQRCQTSWKKTTNRLTTQFWDSIRPDKRCTSVEEWSEL